MSIFKENILRGKVCLITGGHSGIGFGISKLLGQHGCSLAIMGRRQQVLDKAVAELGASGVSAIAVQGDVRKPASCEAVVEQTLAKYGRIDILINGAAGNFLCAAEDLSYNAFRTVIEIDLIGTFNMSRAAFPALKRSGAGNIINISATLHYHSTPWQTHASAAKAGVDSVTTSLATEWAEYGIRVNGIAPGPIKGTPGAGKLAPPGAEEMMKEMVPLNRLGTPKDCAETVLFLVSDGASFVTGHTVVVDGGAWLWSPPYISREMVKEIGNATRVKKPKAKL